MSTRERVTSAEGIKAINGWLTWFWVANFPPVIWLYFAVDSDTFQNLMLLYLALVSIWANVAGHASAWVAGRTEVKVDAQEADVQHADEVNVGAPQEKGST